MTALTLVELHPLPGQRIEPHDGLTLGRADCDVTLNHPQVSRHHATLRVSDARLEIEDPGSRNGTFVNDRRLEAPMELSEGDEVRIGETLWRVEAAAATPAAAAGSGSPQARGDVPPPPAPSVVLPTPPIPQVANRAFVEAPTRRRRASAARRLEATVISYAVVAATAAGVIIYLATR